jgi:hypothetical protein
MKSYNVSDFNKDFNVFRWQHPDIRQTYWTKESEEYNGRKTYTLSTLWYKNDRVMQVYTNDENNSYQRLSIYQTHRDAAFLHGLITNANHSATSHAIIDGLYHKANPPKYYNKNGSLKKGFWGMLVRRLRSNQISASWVTQDMLTEAVKILKQEYNDGIAEHNEELNVEVMHEYIHIQLGVHGASHGSFYRDRVTNKYHVYGNHKRVRIAYEAGAVSYYYIHKSTEPTYHGFVYNQLNDMFYKPDLIIYDGRAYNRSEFNLITCSSCGEEHIETNCVDGVCQNCLGAAFKIHNYSTRVEGMLKFKAKKVKPSTIYLGCELEFETNDRTRAQLGVGKLLQGHALMKSDGSIRNGFEVVTCPATLDIHLETFKKFYDNIPPDLKIESNVGMHVHISRKPLSQLTLGKMAEFLNRLDNKQFIHHIAGRIDNNYAKQDAKRNITFPWKQLRNGGGDRYNALNLQNQNTVEIRLFATPMDYKTFAMRLQFCQALVDYCQPAQNSIPLKQQTHYGSFINWVRQERYSYPELNSHLKGFN